MHKSFPWSAVGLIKIGGSASTRLLIGIPQGSNKPSYGSEDSHIRCILKRTFMVVVARHLKPAGLLHNTLALSTSNKVWLRTMQSCFQEVRAGSPQRRLSTKAACKRCGVVRAGSRLQRPLSTKAASKRCGLAARSGF